ncbi:MAG: hypothetical protein VB010_07010 [Sphaerochaeta associata]|jgi:hypothetical protein|nr:hypothetical protein [Sphaerochaeta associata]MEA5107087.1 hypothetical protein [Sphaerochaeta associata]
MKGREVVLTAAGSSTVERMQESSDMLLSSANKLLEKLFYCLGEEPLKVETAEEFMIVSEILYKVSAKVVELKEYNRNKGD